MLNETPGTAPALQASCTYRQAAHTAKRAVAYYRVSTTKQGQSGLGLEAQQETVQRHLGDQEPMAEYVETESGKRADRPQLRAALDRCRRTGAVLVVAKLDRLARNARFLLELLDSGVQIEFADLPQLSGPQGKFLLASMANVAELEAGLISQRTKAALKQARARGKKLGAQPGNSPLPAYIAANGNTAGVQGAIAAADQRAEIWRGIFEGMVGRRLSLNAMAKELNAAGEVTPRGGRWTAKAASRMIARLDLQASCTNPYSQAA